MSCVQIRNWFLEKNVENKGMLATNNAIELEVLDIVYLFLIFSMCNDINKYKQYYTNGILIINNYSISKNKYYTLIQKLISKQRAQSNSKYQ